MGGLSFEEKRAARIKANDEAPERLTKAPHQSWRLREAAERGDMEQLVSEMTKGVDLNTGSETEFNALHKAAQRNKVEVVRALIEAGVCLNAHSSSSADTPLHVAARAGHVDVVQELIIGGADYTAVNKLGWTPLHSALYSHHMDVARALIRAGCDPTSKTKRGLTPRDVSIRASPHEIDSVLGLNLAGAMHVPHDASHVVEWEPEQYEKVRSKLEAAHRKQTEVNKDDKRAGELERFDAERIRKAQREERNLQLQYTFESTVKRNADILERDESKPLEDQLEKYWEKVEIPEHIPGQKRNARLGSGSDVRLHSPRTLSLLYMENTSVHRKVV